MYNQNNLKVARFASKSTIKPELNSVLFTKDCTVATDSFRLVEMSVPKNAKLDEFPLMDGKLAPLKNSVMVPYDQVAKIKVPKSKNLPILSQAVVCDVDDTFAEIITNDLDSINTKKIRKTKGTFPKYKEIIPKDKPVAPVRVNAKYLYEILQVIGALDEMFGVVTIEFRGEHDPIIVRGENSNQSAIGLVMPMNK